jgi:hypothetical protein
MEQERPAPLCPNHPTVIMFRVVTRPYLDWYVCTQLQSPEMPRTCGNSMGA